MDTYLQTHQMLLSPKAKGDAIPSLIVEVDNVKASHGGTVGELDQEQIFYMMTRGIPRAEAVRVLVEGYFEEVVQRLDDPGLEELVRRRIAEKLAGRRGPGARVHRGARGGRLMGAVADKPLVDVRADFPVLDARVRRATAGLPRLGRHRRRSRDQVIEAMDRFQRESYAPIHRGVYELAREATDAFEGARERIAAFVGWDPTCSIFTRNATEAINLVAYAWGRENVGEGDEVLITEMEHHSNIVPWQIALRGDRREAALPHAHRQRASCRSTSSTRCSPRGA